MKVNELRIGNIISPLGKGITSVEGFCIWDNLIQSSNFTERDIKDFEPIQLTEEWLLKFGFEPVELNVDKTYFIDNGRKCLEIDLSSCTVLYQSNIGIKYIDLNIDLEYVHQLQNLYFALTGEELELK